MYVCDLFCKHDHLSTCLQIQMYRYLVNDKGLLHINIIDLVPLFLIIAFFDFM